MRPSTIPIFATGMFVGSLLTTGFLLGAGTWTANADPGPGTAITEDDPRWDCRTMGDHVCGPHNSNAVAPGLYNEGGLLATWPTVKTCANVGGDLYCDEAFLDPKFVRLVAPSWTGAA